MRSEGGMAESSTRSAGRSRSVLIGILWSAIVAGALAVVSLAGFKPEGPDAWTYDWRTLLFSKTASEPRRDIAIVLVGEESLAQYDYLSPVDRGLMAKLVRALDEAGPKAIGLDFLFDRKSEDNKTAALIEAIKTARTPVVIGAIDARATRFKKDSLRYQDAFLKASGAETGHVFFARDVDKVKIGEQVVRYIADPPDKGLPSVLARQAKPLSPLASSYIAWLLPPRGSDLFTVLRVPRHDPDAGPAAVLPPSWRAALKGKLVLVGGDFADRDRHLTPLSIWDGAKLPGVMIHGQILAQRLDGRSIALVPRDIEFALMMIAALFGFLISERRQSKRAEWTLYGVGIAVLVVAGVVLFRTFSVILPTTMLFLAWMAGVSGARYSESVLRWLGIGGRAERPAKAEAGEAARQQEAG